MCIIILISFSKREILVFIQTILQNYFWLASHFICLHFFNYLKQQTRPNATVEVEISEDMQLVHFDFNR